jgi:hypothetical protein
LKRAGQPHLQRALVKYANPLFLPKIFSWIHVRIESSVVEASTLTQTRRNLSKNALFGAQGNTRNILQSFLPSYLKNESPKKILDKMKSIMAAEVLQEDDNDEPNGDIIAGLDAHTPPEVHAIFSQVKNS